MSKCGKCCYGVMTMPNKMFCSVQNCFCEEVFDCEDYEPIVKQQTNADRIRAMADEELARFFDLEAFLCPWCDMSCGDVEEIPCRQCVLKWLKQEADS